MLACFTVIWVLSFASSKVTDIAHDKLLNNEPGSMNFYYMVKVIIYNKYFINNYY